MFTLLRMTTEYGRGATDKNCKNFYEVFFSDYNNDFSDDFINRARVDQKLRAVFLCIKM